MALPPLCVIVINCLLLGDYLQPVAEVIEVSFYGSQLRRLLPALERVDLRYPAHHPILDDAILGYPLRFSDSANGAL